MANPNNRYVQRRPDKRWEVVGPHAERASAVGETQREMEKRAKEIVGNLGGGEAVVKDVHGRIRDSDTVRPGHDPCPPRDKKH